jgi:hypothetical protein
MTIVGTDVGAELTFALVTPGRVNCISAIRPWDVPTLLNRQRLDAVCRSRQISRPRPGREGSWVHDWPVGGRLGVLSVSRSSGDWSLELDELTARVGFAAEMVGAEAVERQRAAGRLTVRQRFEILADPGTFQEVGRKGWEPAFAG